ncbi:hypothetical protein SLEP1_g21227 [Rubroshorea leprosula]|uniref:BZIP domain-containing protein n=1 Tax=Rubroshorea leprosula TaxID=152421 RepID=A0AAV5JBD9_9ROSI|nr:hypothetical protein SLEP1_g21227 [Rubroshorea leprosula]
MAESNIGGSKGYEKGQLVIEDDPVDWNMDELLSYLPDQQTTDPEQNLQQGFDPPAGPNGCLPEPSIYPAPNEAAASTPWPIAQQYSGQSPGTFPGNPSSQIPDSLLKKRGYNKKYRANLKRKRQELEGQKKSFEAENERLKRGKQELEEQTKSFEAENETLKRENETLKGEKQELEEQKESFEAENETLKRENETLKRENETLKGEKQELEEQKKSFEAENETLKREKHELEDQIQVKEQEKKFILQTECKQLRDEVKAQRRDMTGEVTQLGNKFDKLELKQRNVALPSCFSSEILILL